MRHDQYYILYCLKGIYFFVSYRTWTEKELDEGDWRTLALQRMARILRTHVVKFDFSEDKNTPEKGTFISKYIFY